MPKDVEQQIAQLMTFSTGEIQRMRRRANAERKKGFAYLVVRITHRTLQLDDERVRIPVDFRPLASAYSDIDLAQAAARRERAKSLRTDESVEVLDIEATHGNPDLAYLKHGETRKA